MELMIQSKVYDKLKDKLLEAKDEILKAINEQRPILLKHHSDTDGYCSGLALEKAILSVIKKTKPYKNPRPYFKRTSLRTPFYDYSDCIRDISIAKDFEDRFDLKKPLVIIADTGTSLESIMALKRLKLESYKIMVIDHHYDNNKETDKLIDIHINPNLVKKNSNNIVAGFLCSELANLLVSDKNFAFTALLAGYGDKSDAVELKEYQKLFDFDEETIIKIITIIDFESLMIRGDGYSLIDKLIVPNKKDIKKIIDTYYDDIVSKINLFVDCAEKYNKQEVYGNLILNLVEVYKINFNPIFPSNVRILSRLQDRIKDTNPKKFVISLGINDQSISIRGSHNINYDKIRFDVNEIIKLLREKYPDNIFDGGGHPLAGTIKFSNIIKEDVISFVVEYCKNKNI